MLIVGLAALIWVATFYPAWRMLIRLSARSLRDESPWLDGVFWIEFVIYRALIAAPYLVLLMGGDSLPAFIRGAVIGWLVLGVLLSLLRLLGRERLEGLLWQWYARVYDALLHFSPYRHLVDQVARRVPSSTTSVLDLGCGTGNFLLALRESRLGSGVELTAVDSSQQMLSRFRAKLSRDQSGPSVRLVEADAVEYLRRVESNSVGCVLSINQLYTFNEEDRSAFFREITRVLEPEGRLVLVTATSSGLWPIVREHLSERSVLSLLRPSLILVFVFNIWIEVLAGAGSFEFIEGADLLGEARACGLLVEDSVAVYGGTGLLIQASAT